MAWATVGKRSLFFKCSKTSMVSPAAASVPLPLNMWMHFTAASASSKFTKPWRLDTPAASRATTAEVMAPQGANAACNCASETSALRFFTNTFVNARPLWLCGCCGATGATATATAPKSNLQGQG